MKKKDFFLIFSNDIFVQTMVHFPQYFANVVIVIQKWIRNTNCWLQVIGKKNRHYVLDNHDAVQLWEWSVNEAVAILNWYSDFYNNWQLFVGNFNCGKQIFIRGTLDSNNCRAPILQFSVEIKCVYWIFSRQPHFALSSEFISLWL